MPRRLGPPLLVLDFDGVIAESIPGESALDRLRRDAVNRLSRIVAESSAEVVVSSTWRRDTRTGVGWSGPQLEVLLGTFGFQGRIVGVTPFLPGGRRVAEIQHYIDRMPVEPRALCILEDDHPMEHLTPWTVRTDYDVRLTDADAAVAIRLLTARGRAARPPRRSIAAA